MGLMTEGTTDIRFLSSVITRSFEELIITESDELPDIYTIEIIDSIPGSFTESVLNASKVAAERGVGILCVHTDADARNDSECYENKIIPAFKNIKNLGGELCENLVAVVPVQMTEAWMMADIGLLKEELMTEKSNETLQITRQPESIANPKEVIKLAINIAYQEIPRRRKRYEITISDLYLPIGQKINLDRLRVLPSYRKFIESARTTLQSMGYF